MRNQKNTATKEHKHAKLQGSGDYLGNGDRDPRKWKRNAWERSRDEDNYQWRKKRKQVKKSSIEEIAMTDREEAEG
ncbi:hypothetical protein SAY86_007107 [Trapa natans]|uniref:Uncharacterized protein n=1 Tax=Trapa natans TaxID=22666 RepID=A0AAN7R1T5_TRANT|nr:hypothetical protein SAY86_007107 [Trapa natans]